MAKSVMEFQWRNESDPLANEPVMLANHGQPGLQKSPFMY